MKETTSLPPGPAPLEASSQELSSQKSSSQESSPLAQTIRLGTEIWHDGAVAAELAAAVAAGATGATSNPSLVLEAVRREAALWAGRVRALAAERPGASDIDLAAALVSEVAGRGAAILQPLFEREGGRRGRFAAQVTPATYGNAEATVAEGLAIATAAPNLQPKIPATRAGIAALEELTARGVTAMATACFTVSQAVAVGEAIERGLARRAAAGHDTAAMTPLCVFLIGRTDDWFAGLAEREGREVEPGLLGWPGIACLKTAYGLYQDRGFRTRLLVAGFRREEHWSAFVGGDLVISLTPVWARRVEAWRMPVRPAIGQAVPAPTLASLVRAFPEFARALSPDGFGIEEFDVLAPMVRTLRGFLRARHELLAFIADALLPDPFDRLEGPAAPSPGDLHE